MLPAFTVMETFGVNSAERREITCMRAARAGFHNIHVVLTVGVGGELDGVHRSRSPAFALCRHVCLPPKSAHYAPESVSNQRVGRMEREHK